MLLFQLRIVKFKKKILPVFSHKQLPVNLQQDMIQEQLVVASWSFCVDLCSQLSDDYNISNLEQKTKINILTYFLFQFDVLKYVTDSAIHLVRQFKIDFKLKYVKFRNIAVGCCIFLNVDTHIFF